MLNETSSANGTNGTSAEWDLAPSVVIFSMFFMILLAIGIVLVNGFALYVVHKDPLQCFRTPLATFVTGILAANFITGIALPFIVASWTTGHPAVALIGGILPYISINTSFLTVLALAVAQLLALGWHATYEKRVSRRSAICGIICIWIYTVFIFPLLLLVHWWLFVVLDLILHMVLLTIALVIIYIITYFIFKRALQKQQIVDHREEDDEAGEAEAKHPSEAVEREFVKGTFILTLTLIITSWPSAIALFVWFFNTDRSHREFTALILCYDVLFVKFFLDPFVFVWRMPKYRRAVKLIWMKCCCAFCKGCIKEPDMVARYDAADNTHLDMTIA